MEKLRRYLRGRRVIISESGTLFIQTCNKTHLGKKEPPRAIDKLPDELCGIIQVCSVKQRKLVTKHSQQAPCWLSAPLSGSQSANNQPVFETGLRPLSCSLLSCGHVYRLRLRFRHMTRVCQILCRPEIFHVCRSQSARLHVFQGVTVNAFGAFFCIPAHLKPPLTFTSVRRHRARCSDSRRAATKGALL